MLNWLKHKAFFKTQSLHATLSSVMWIRFITKMYVIQLWASEMDFEVEGPWNTETIADKKKLWILDALAWLKKKHFDPGHSLLIVPALKLFCFLPLFLFSSIKSSLILSFPSWVYSGICLKRTPSVQKNLFALDRCPLYREFS